MGASKTLMQEQETADRFIDAFFESDLGIEDYCMDGEPVDFQEFLDSVNWYRDAYRKLLEIKQWP